MFLKLPYSRLVCWQSKLVEFDYEIEKKWGKSNTNADAPSHVEIHTKEFEELFKLAQYVQKFNEPTKNRKEQEKHADYESFSGNAPEAPLIENVIEEKQIQPHGISNDIEGTISATEDQRRISADVENTIST